MNSVVRDDVYLRWTQFGVFSSHMRYHGTNKREPWHYPSIAPAVKRWWKLRYALIPYILQESRKATESGATIVQAMIFHNSDDPTCYHIDDQYYFGDSFLVAPVMNSENRRDIYLPEGEWIDFFTGEKIIGGKWIKNKEVAMENMPVYVRPGTTIPFYPYPVDCTDEMDLTKTVSLTINDSFRGIWNEKLFN